MVTVVGGMGSVPGAFLAALIIGELQAFGILIFPKITLVLVFLLMALVLVVRPWGLLGRPEAAGARRCCRKASSRSRASVAPSMHRRGAWPALPRWRCRSSAMPTWSRSAIEVLCFALAAFSLNFLIGVGGIVSFGHAAYFGLGAYAAGLR